MDRVPIRDAYDRQVRQLPADLQERECGLIEIGRRHAAAFDDGHTPSGSAAHRVLTELRKLADRDRVVPKTEKRSQLDELRARRAAG